MGDGNDSGRGMMDGRGCSFGKFELKVGGASFYLDVDIRASGEGVARAGAGSRRPIAFLISHQGGKPHSGRCLAFGQQVITPIESDGRVRLFRMFHLSGFSPSFTP